MWVPQELPKEQAREIESLVTCWRRGQEKAAVFIEAAKEAILTWQAIPQPTEPATDIRDRAASLRESAGGLNRVLSGASPDFISALQAEIRERLANGISPERFVMLEGWQCLSAHLNGMNRPESPALLRAQEILDPLQEILSLVSEAAGELEADTAPKPGRSVDQELWLIDQLVKAHQAAFGRMPGKSADSPFLLFWEGLKPILGTESSYQVVINQVRALDPLQD